MEQRLEDLQQNPAQQTTQTSPISEGGTEDSTAVMQAEAFDYKSAIGKLIEVIQWFVVVLEITMAIRFVFKLLGADPTNPFVGFLYALTDVILVLFSTIFPPLKIHPNNVLEWSTLVGMVIIWLFYEAIRRLLEIISSDPGEQAS